MPLSKSSQSSIDLVMIGYVASKHHSFSYNNCVDMQSPFVIFVCVCLFVCLFFLFVFFVCF